ncbi:hypothetical protein ZWY2020_047545 [Hordeum vulgare]|nr:hypothetical protein ZWY2020_047545 [Hordeum vulgare]
MAASFLRALPHTRHTARAIPAHTSRAPRLAPASPSHAAIPPPPRVSAKVIAPPASPSPRRPLRDCVARLVQVVLVVQRLRGVGGGKLTGSCKMEVLSEQQLVDCDHECAPSEPDSCDAGCNGGLMASAFSYLLKSGGLEREKGYPYTGKDGTCKFDKSKIDASVQNYSVVAVDEEQIAANLVKYGPLAIGINAAYMQTYIGGVSCPYICGRHLDHGVLLVGYGASGFAPSRFKEKPYWIVKNSWGENWGDQGYYKICRGSNVRNKCGVDSMVSTVSATHSSKEEQALV